MIKITCVDKTVEFNTHLNLQNEVMDNIEMLLFDPSKK